MGAARWTVATSINEKGEIVGYFSNSFGGSQFTFVRAADGTITGFFLPGPSVPIFRATAFSINAAGATTGNFPEITGFQFLSTTDMFAIPRGISLPSIHRAVF